MLTACHQYVRVFEGEFRIAAEGFSGDDVILFEHVVAERATDCQHAVDALVATDEPTRISDALRLLGQARLVSDCQTNSLPSATERW